MRTMTSIAMAMTVAGGLIGASFSASAADSKPDNTFYDGQVHRSYAQPYNDGVSNVPTTRFYYDGQYHPTYEPVPSRASRSLPGVPTGRFYYDGQFHDTYVPARS